MWAGLARQTPHKTAWQLVQSAVEALKGQPASGISSSIPSVCQPAAMSAAVLVTNMAALDVTLDQDQAATRPLKRMRHDVAEGSSKHWDVAPAGKATGPSTDRAPVNATNGAKNRATAALLASKSTKRQAAEALLASRFSNSSNSALGSDSGCSSGSLRQPSTAAAAGPSDSISSGAATYATAVRVEDEEAAQPSSSTNTAHVGVAACDSSCSHHVAHGWCQQEARIPHVDWAKLLTKPPAVKSRTHALGYEQHSLGHGLEVLVVENPLYVAPALAKLRASMADPYVSLDLEWRPEFGKGQRSTPVAMLQLSSATTAVLVRTCRMQYKLPLALRSFLADPAITLIGFSWFGSDEHKMQATFGGGAATLFAPSFLDLRNVAEGLGYHGHGLQRLARAVLGVELPKSKNVTMSNWEQKVLSSKQVRYAALDVLVCGQVFRGLRLWHSVGSTPCAACLQPLGQVLSMAPTRFVCSADGCGKATADVKAYLNHCSQTKHAPVWQECGACSRVCRLPATAPAAAAGTADSAHLA